MTTTGYRYKSDFARRHFDRGRAEGEARGRAEGESKAVLAILDAREVEVPDKTRAEITDCTDVDQLEVWIRRAITADKIDELFD